MLIMHSSCILFHQKYYFSIYFQINKSDNTKYRPRDVARFPPADSALDKFNEVISGNYFLGNRSTDCSFISL